ncbi:hypothetical protein N7537_000107 [Penicillium hordei]|uniref:Uncharacterized protein n=1 Tax=Penicillium hordei TaxID=40994 RepID=A0AAD6EDA9_9EURO|nr:uncharacterized protein N7537_000107 [Penicillium hordei]KAJ5614993.1 hypothetical protein N7537_000107 [Penicillium hordei]
MYKAPAEVLPFELCYIIGARCSLTKVSTIFTEGNGRAAGWLAWYRLLGDGGLFYDPMALRNWREVGARRGP